MNSNTHSIRAASTWPCPSRDIAKGFQGKGRSHPRHLFVVRSGTVASITERGRFVKHTAVQKICGAVEGMLPSMHNNFDAHGRVFKVKKFTIVTNL